MHLFPPRPSFFEWVRSGPAPRARLLPRSEAIPIHPQFRALPSPVILIGMHRSGTSVASAILAALGIYVGPRLLPWMESDVPNPTGEREPWPDHAEAREFRRLNDAILAAAGAAWNRAEPFLACAEDPQFSDAAVRRLQRATFGGLRRDFLGPLPAGFRGGWGWKDPRTTLTLPYWLRLFPGARVLHVRREVAAVVESLHRRALAWHVPAPSPPKPLPRKVLDAARHPERFARRLGARLRPHSVGPEPCLDRAHCERLARLYVDQAAQYRRQVDAFLDVSYEALLEQPQAMTRRIAEFAAPQAADERVERAANLIRR